jgi:FtsP/CotA-like multicopper oxidase with cupredoxin domain
MKPILVLGLASVVASTIALQTARDTSAPTAPWGVIDPFAGRDPTQAISNDNREPAGELRGQALALRLVARAATWQPEGAAGPTAEVYAFAEEGETPRIPGPLIRVPVGTEVRATLRNALPDTLRVFGLQDRPAQGGTLDSVVLVPDETREIRFRAGSPGTYLYWGRTLRDTFPFGQFVDGQLSGAIVVDSTGAPRTPTDRILVVGLWKGNNPPFGTPVEKREEALVVNGLSWPHTERLRYSVGDSVHWRVINASRRPHPLHLHGFYYRVDARGTPLYDSVYAPNQQRLVVTEIVTPGRTMSMSWSPHTPGNWLFHCHLAEHISTRMKPQEREKSMDGTHHGHGRHTMSGLAVGLEVSPRPGESFAAVTTPRRTLRVFVTQRDRVFGEASGYSFILQEGAREPASDSLRVPSSPVMVTRGEPTAITVINRAREPVIVHWHGIELESYFDGVGAWSGWQNKLAPTIAPGDSFVAHMTPPRSGTFMFHTHHAETHQLGGGLVAPLLVLDPGQPRDTLLDRVFLLSTAGPFATSPPSINGKAPADPIELRAGTTYRLRFVSIAPNDGKVIRLLSGDAPVRWRAVAKDGADLPPHQAVMRPAVILMGPGETADFELTVSEPAELSLDVLTVGRVGLPPVRSAIPVHVRAPNE